MLASARVKAPLCKGSCLRAAQTEGLKPCLVTPTNGANLKQHPLYTPCPNPPQKLCQKKRKKCLTKVIHLAIIIKLSREGTAAKACNYSLYGDFEAGRLQKISKKVLDKRAFMRYNIQAVTKHATAQQDLENWTKLKLVEPWCEFWKLTINNSKFTSNSYRTQAIVSEWLQRFNTL